MEDPATIIERSYELALGPLGLRPSEFWALTPAELAAMAEGFNERQKLSQRKMAWQTAYILNAISGLAGGRMITPEELMGEVRHTPADELPKTQEEAKAMIDEFMAVHALTREERLRRFPELFRANADLSCMTNFVEPNQKKDA